MLTVGELLAIAVARLRDAGSESARLDAELLLGAAIGADRTTLVAHPEMAVGDVAAERFEASLVRRSRGEPVAYIRGIKEFFGLAFAVDDRALIPRPETERLVELGLAEVMARLTSPDRGRDRAPVRIVDVGTGSGAVAISLAVELRRRRVALGADVAIVATDRSPAALGLARENAVGHAVGDIVEFVDSDLVSTPDGDAARFDLILANLPYVRTDAIGGLPVAASFEPVLALDGGGDGLDVIRRLLRILPDALTERGVALLEIGADHGAAGPVAVAAELPGWRAVVETDLAGLPRVLRVERGGAA